VIAWNAIQLANCGSKVLAGEHGAALAIEGGVHLVLRVLAQHAERPLDVGRQRQPARARALVGDAQQRELDRCGGAPCRAMSSVAMRSARARTDDLPAPWPTV
jgi:hypothetical protein